MCHFKYVDGYTVFAMIAGHVCCDGCTVFAVMVLLCFLSVLCYVCCDCCAVFVVMIVLCML